MKKGSIAGPKKTSSELSTLLDQLKVLTGKGYSKMALECGFEGKNYFSQVLSREKNGVAVPTGLMGKLRSKYAGYLGDRIIVELADDQVIKTLMENIVALKTQVRILTREVAELRAYCYRSGFDNEHAKLKDQMREGVESTARTM